MKSNLVVLSIISEKSEVGPEGIKTDSDIRINGRMIGNITSKGVVIIGENATVQGNIIGKSIDISGKVMGESIKSSSTTTLRERANVQSKIITKDIVVEVGAKFNGVCSMEDEKK